MNFSKRLGEFKEEFDRCLNYAFVKEENPAMGGVDADTMRVLLDYILDGGKRLRPFIFLLGCDGEQMFEDQGLVDVAMGFELLHNSTLIVDDMIDHHEERRGGPTLPVKLDGGFEHMPNTLLVANLLRDGAFRIISEADVDDGFKNRCLRAFMEISYMINQAQISDLFSRGNLDISGDYILDQMRGVTAIFFEKMILLGLQDGEESAVWSSIGLQVGEVFQLVDDLLDLYPGKKGRIGFGADIREGKVSSLIYAAYSFLPTDVQEEFRVLFGKDSLTDEELVELTALIKSSGAVDYLRALISRKSLHIRNISEGVDGKGLVTRLSEYIVGVV